MNIMKYLFCNVKFISISIIQFIHFDCIYIEQGGRKSQETTQKLHLISTYWGLFITFILHIKGVTGK